MGEAGRRAGGRAGGADDAGLRGVCRSAAPAGSLALKSRIVCLRPCLTTPSPCFPLPPAATLAARAAGPSLLVAPVLDQGATDVRVVLPGGGMWYDNLDGAAIDSALPANRNFRWA